MDALTAALYRPGRLDDVSAIVALYKDVATRSGGIARRAGEVTLNYVRDFVEASLVRGIIVVAEFPDATRLAGELHAYRSELRNLKHALGELTVAVHPDAQGRGIGRRLFEMLLEEVKTGHPDIARVDLQDDPEFRRLVSASG